MKHLGYLMDAETEPKIIAKKKLSDKEYEDILNLIIEVDKIVFLYKEILPVLEGYKDIEKGLKKYHVGINRDERSLKTLVQNYLSTIRAYIDTMEHTFNKYYGKDNDYFLKFRELKKERYESSFSYRFVEALRNFSQHRSVPIDSVYMGVENEKEVIKLIVNKKTILDDKKFKRKIKDEVEKYCDSQINILSYFDEMNKCLNFINAEMIIAIILDKVNIFKEFFSYEEFLQGEYQNLILINVIETKENYDKINLKMKYFQFDNIRNIINHHYPWEKYIKLNGY